MTADTQLASTHVGLLWFIKFEFATGTMYRTTWSHTLPWDGHDWLGLTAALSISPIQSSEQLQYPPLDIALNVANPAQLALALGPPAAWRKRPITLYLQVLDDELRMLDEPELYWAGLMDHIKLNTGDGSDGGSVVLRCELTGRKGSNASSLRLNNAQHQQRHPGDTGLSRIEQLTGQPKTWLSKKFQRI